MVTSLRYHFEDNFNSRARQGKAGQGTEQKGTSWAGFDFMTIVTREGRYCYYGMTLLWAHLIGKDETAGFGEVVRESNI
ncbi:uncharacterized protein Bfra_008531 [Botrytis fragariae]|uniref:Uncharacterized protein n=1 Tax=Botrytis fragariae TaxID=1964551 RepID=A0A8H6ATN8_9HELO|nr:uncharacterized protein Bfra_008531 [Botrytis fragariae]KAF5873250.1 hypothetical protein Bfra_008531 [Botrytis fragariae]